MCGETNRTDLPRSRRNDLPATAKGLGSGTLEWEQWKPAMDAGMAATRPENAWIVDWNYSATPTFSFSQAREIIKCTERKGDAGSYFRSECFEVGWQNVPRPGKDAMGGNQVGLEIAASVVQSVGPSLLIPLSGQRSGALFGTLDKLIAQGVLARWGRGLNQTMAQAERSLPRTENVRQADQPKTGHQGAWFS